MSILSYLRRPGFLLVCLAFGGTVPCIPAIAAEGNPNPLLAIDTSSPRDTLQTLQMLSVAIEDAVIVHQEAPSSEKQAEVYRLMQKIVALLDLSDVSPTVRRDTAREAIAFLVDVLRRIDVPPLEAIPAADQYPDVAKPASWSIPGTEITISRVMSGPKAGHFLFDAETVARSGEFYAEVKSLPLRVPARINSWREVQLQLHGWMIPNGLVAMLPRFLRTSVFDTPLWKIIGSLGLIGLLGGLLAIWARFVQPDELAHTPRSYLERLLLPAAMLLAISAASYANAFQFITIGRFSGLIDSGLALSWYIAAAWAAWLLIFAFIEWVIESPKIPDQSLDANLLRLLARVLGILSVASIAAYGAQELGLPVVGVIAGLGVGGLAVALAAQSSIENLIGGLNLYADRPIRMGDFCDYAGIQGHVEHIGLRSTRIRGLDRTVTSVPNSLLAKVHITNYALRDQMLFKHTLDLRYETTTTQLRDVVHSIAAYFDGHKIVLRNVTLPRVRVVGFGDWSIKVEVYAYVDATELPQFLIIQQELVLAIIDLVLKTGADFAFPSQTLYLGKDTPSTSIDSAPMESVKT